MRHRQTRNRGVTAAECLPTVLLLVAQSSCPVGSSPSNPFLLLLYTSCPRTYVWCTTPLSVRPSYGESLFLKFRLSFVTCAHRVSTVPYAH
jgi:hypothetical protein